MYTLIPFKYWAILFAIVAVAIFVMTVPTDAGFIPLCGTAYRAASFSALFFFILGQTPLFPWICRIPGVNKIFPDLEGIWIATLYSNWPEIAKRLDPPANPNVAPKVGKIRIEQRLFTMKMILDMDDNYTKSHTIFVRPRRCPTSGRLQLHYIYEAQTNVPVETDSASHHGAGSVDIKQDAGKTWMDGVYWTDRNWTKGLNTAGRITLERPAK